MGTTFWRLHVKTVQYSTCTSLPHKLYFIILDGTRPECPLKLAVFYEVMPPSSVTEVCQHFSATACLHHLPWSRRQQVLCNVSISLPDYMASHISRHKSSSSLHENITSGINIHHLVSRQANLIVQVMELRAVCITTEEYEICEEHFIQPLGPVSRPVHC